MAGTIRVLCVDDHEILADGLAARLDLEDDIECVGRLNRTNGLVDEVRRTHADIVVQDIEMPGPDTFEMIAELKRHCPDARVIILSAHVRDTFIDRALNSGAVGFYSKADSPSQIVDGIRRVAHGEHAFGPDVLERMEEIGPGGDAPESRYQTLTPREMEILRMIGRGMSRADIARTLCRSPKTIDAHHTSIMRKLDIHDRAELTRYAIREGLVVA